MHIEINMWIELIKASDFEIQGTTDKQQKDSAAKQYKSGNAALTRKILLSEQLGLTYNGWTN